MKTKLTLVTLIIIHLTFGVKSQVVNDIIFYYDNDPIINLCFNKISADSIEQNISDLENFETRFALMPNRKQVAKWIQNRFIELGYSNTVIDSFQTNTYNSYIPWVVDTITWQYNVIANIQGSEFSDSSVLIGSHYDSYSYDNAPVSAPGADDNASGVGAIIEIARVFKEINYVPSINIKFLFFGAEEIGLCGSSYHANKLVQYNEKIKFFLDLDMIANNPSQTNYQMNINSYDNSTDVEDFAVYCCNNYSGVIPNVYNNNSMFSDSYSFYINDYKTVYFEEYESCPNIHSDYDITDNCNMDYCKEIAKISLAMLVNSSSSITHIENFEESIITMNIYPNPTKGKITIKAESAKCIEVINIEGKQVYIGNENEIDLSLQPKGIYIIKVITDKQTINKKIIKL